MTLSRRSVLKAGVTAGVTALAASWDPLAFAQVPRIRYKATSTQGKAMLVKYARAVTLMKDTSRYPATDPRHWNFQWYTHWIPGVQSPWSEVAATKKQMLDKVFAGLSPVDPKRMLAEAMWDDCQAHASNPGDPNFYQEYFFCVWHRWFVYYFEEIVRAVLQDSSFTLPYWDYLSGNVADLSIPPEFRDTSSALYRPNRNPWVNAGERIDKQNPGAMNLNALRETFYIDTPNGNTGFCPALDQNPHGSVHVFVGDTTNMGRVPFAGNDPVFWLHHCNIDRLWESWNRIPGRLNPPWPNRLFPFANGTGMAVAVPPSGANRVSLLQYSYDSYSTPPNLRAAPAQPTSALSAAAPMRVTKANAPERVTLGTDRARVALKPATTVGRSAPSADAVFGLSPQAKRLYLVLGDITAPGDAASTYNVFLDLPEGATADSADDPHYVGTLNFFGAAGHEQHAGGGGHPTVFNVTEQVKALKAKGALTASPSVTLVRRGDPESEKPSVGQIVLFES